MEPRMYVLDGERNVVEASEEQWSAFLEGPAERVLVAVAEAGGEVALRTHFTGLNARPDADPPVVFTTVDMRGGRFAPARHYATSTTPTDIARWPLLESAN